MPDAWDTTPMTQFVFRGAETTQGRYNVSNRSIGEDTQLIYPHEGDILWYELQVWTGVPPQDKSNRRNSYRVADVIDGSRRHTRLIRLTHQTMVEMLKHFNVDTMSVTMRGPAGGSIPLQAPATG